MGSRYLVVVLPYLTVGLAVLLASLAVGGATLYGRRLASASSFSSGRPPRLREGQPVSPVGRRSRRGTTMVAPRFAPRAQHTCDSAASAKMSDYLVGPRPAERHGPEGVEDHGFSQQFVFSLDFWWLYLFYLGLLRGPSGGRNGSVRGLGGAFARGVGRELA